MKPGTLQVLTNSPGRLGRLAIWVSCSATWITLVPVRCAMRAQPSLLAGADMGRQDAVEIARHDRIDGVAHALGEEGGDLRPVVRAVDDGDAVERHVEMADDERQGAVTHRPEPDHQDAAAERLLSHDFEPPESRQGAGAKAPVPPVFRCSRS